jgi:hypothetical protein
MVLMLVGCTKEKKTTLNIYQKDCVTLVKTVNLGVGDFKINIIGDSVYTNGFLSDRKVAEFDKDYCVFLEYDKEES